MLTPSRESPADVDLPLLPASRAPSAREADAFCAHFCPRAPGHPAVRDLYALLCRAAVLGGEPAGIQSGGFEARTGWLEALVRWLKEPQRTPLPEPEPEPAGAEAADEVLIPVPPDSAAAALPHARLLLLARVLETLPEARAHVGRLVRAVLAGSQGLKLFAQVGVPGGQGFVGEVTDRFARKLLPTPPEEGELSALLPRLFPREADAAWLSSLPPAAVARLALQLGEWTPPEVEPSAQVRGWLLDALVVLSVRTASLGLSPAVLDRLPGHALRANPFLRLRRVADSMVSRDGHPEALRELGQALEECHGVVATVHQHLEHYGVSVDLVYRLERIRRGLLRMGRIARVLAAPRGEARWAEGLALLSVLVRRSREDRSVGALVQGNVRQLARKVIERAGVSGEHYITATRAEWHQMVHSAAGGGLLTAFTAAIKVTLGTLSLAPFFVGLFASLNYAGSFVLMQFLGFTLATKQPSMTAAALAGALARDEGATDLTGAPGLQESGRLERLVELIARITRSQLAAALGNLSMVLPAGVGLALAVQLLSGRALLTPEQAQYVVHSLHPWKSLCLPFAALTGVMLWMASVTGGWMENWAVYRRLPEAIAAHRGVRRVLGPQRAEALGRLVLRQVGPVGGLVCLGFLLAMTPAVAGFFGVHLEVRHVTLSFGSLALAGAALGPQAALEPDFLAAVLGVGLVGLLNFGVSFALALAVALRARDVPRGSSLVLARGVASAFRRNPRTFFVPPREPEQDCALEAPPAVH
ncbi:gliding motility protein [Aggregicoccus sp. 17bor-14]|uniref:gliding motility protein n=1 Tax=Myxococcaceae TaxID=31 RepID=UPI00129CCD7A|nr:MULTISPECIES: gliding motility protein [Myxococcaceae]MBF5046139.1 gliding motility protein [Simulacricoccus sp. 17bor-14]MRI91866.1 gliding motility protein [Aggregicoccus sp. 17bor-14]